MKTNFVDKLDPRVKEYFTILEPEFPAWLNDYINTPALLKQQHISVTSGKIYSKLFKYHFFYSSLEHSIAVALIIWHFTHDKKQTLSGLFHDIATPVFKHCIDFLNGDYMVQESTEDMTTKTIIESKEIMELLSRDGIDISEVDNYHIYPIADNDTPQLAADRLEYSLSNSLFESELSTPQDVKEFYDGIIVSTNEKGFSELAFKTKKIARNFVKLTSQLSIGYRDEISRYSMQFLADIIKELNSDGVITREDLYSCKESDIIKTIEKSKYGKIFQTWRDATRISTSDTKPAGVYYVHHGAKIRYIDPLVVDKRISSICKIASNMIAKNLSYDMDKYIFLPDISDHDILPDEIKTPR